MNHLLHPELLQNVPLIGSQITDALDRRIHEALLDDLDADPPITVAIRTFNEAPKLERLLQDVSKQMVRSEVELVVVDNESADHTKDIAKEYGAELVTLPRGEFTYPRSMNLAMSAASNDAVFLTVAHAQLPSTYTLHAGVRHFKPDRQTGGVFAMALPAQNTTKLGGWLDAGLACELFRSPHVIKKAGMGAMAAIGAYFSKEVWSELGYFDERYETGGEDTAMARSMIAAGYDVVKDPALAVHHSHGLGLLATAKEVIHYAQTVHGPQSLQQGTVLQRRLERFKAS